MLSEKEQIILKLLRENCRSTITELAKSVTLPRSTTYDKIKKLRSSGIIKRYTCLLNFQQLGKPIHTTVLFKCASDKEKFAQELQNSPHTNNVTKLGNEFDFLASFVFQNMDFLHSYLDEISAKYNIEDYRIFYISKELKREGFSPSI